MGKAFTLIVVTLLVVSLGLIVWACVGPKEDLWPLLLAGVGTMVATVLGALLGVFLIGGVGRMRRRARTILRNGKPATGVVVAAQRVGEVLREGLDFPKYHADVIVDVYPEGGGPFRARVHLFIYEHEWPRLSPGLPIQVKVDPARPSDIALPGFGGIDVERPTAGVAATPDMDTLARLPPSPSRRDPFHE